MIAHVGHPRPFTPLQSMPTRPKTPPIRTFHTRTHACAGTFVLTDEPVQEPPVRLAAEVAEAGLSPQEFVAVPHGTTVTA